MPEDILTNLEKFENEIKDILQIYDNKIRDEISGADYNTGLVTLKVEQEYIKKSESLIDLYKSIEKQMRKHIEGLQVV